MLRMSRTDVQIDQTDRRTDTLTHKGTSQYGSFIFQQKDYYRGDSRLLDYNGNATKFTQPRL